MEKIKYYQLTFKNGECRKLISPSRTEITSLLVDGWELHGFDNEADIPVNPILDDGTVREMTVAEIEATEQANKLARTVFPADSIIEAIEAVDAENENTALSTKLATVLSSNAAFSIYWSAYSNAIDLEHPVCAQALTNFTDAEIQALKLAIP